MDKGTDRIYYNAEHISFFWKFWQATLYIVGSTCFLTGSIIYFPEFYYWIDAELWGDIFFVVGSLSYFFAQIREWKYHLGFAFQLMPQYKDQSEIFIFKERKRYNKYFFIYMLGNVLYLIGCIICIPSFNNYQTGIRIFLSGFGLLVCIQIHKLFNVLLDQKTICQQIRADRARAIMQIVGATSQWMYFTGTLLFQWSETVFLDLTLYTWGVIFYVIGGVSSCLYSIVYFKKLLQLQQDFSHSLISSNSSSEWQKEKLKQTLI